MSIRQLQRRQDYGKRAVAVRLLGVTILSIVTGMLEPLTIQTVHAAAGIYAPISYQGKVSTSGGVAVGNGAYNMRFRLYDAATSGTKLWEEARTGSNKVTMTGGLFSVRLGEVVSMTGSVNFNTDNLFLQVEFDPGNDGTFEEVFSPRRRFSAVPYAHNANTVDGLDSTQLLRRDTSQTASGTLTIQTDGVGLNVLGTASGSKIFAMKTLASSGVLVVKKLAGTATGNILVIDTKGLVYDATNKRVGVGTAAPKATLDVVGTISGAALVVNGTSAFNGNIGIFTTANNAELEILGTISGSILRTLSGANIGNGKLYVSGTSGNVGIGTTAPASKAHILYPHDGSVGLIVQRTGDGAGNMQEWRGHLSTVASISQTGLFTTTGGISVLGTVTFGTSGVPGTIVGDNNNGFLKLNSGAWGSDNNIYLNDANANNVLLVTGGGNVGIGTTSPDSKLEVAGTISGSALTVSGLKSCSMVVTNGNGVTSCGTAYTQTTADNRYVNTSGDTMTGALRIQLSGIGLQVTGTASGRVLHAEHLLTSSGSLSVTGTGTILGRLAVGGLVEGYQDLISGLALLRVRDTSGGDTLSFSKDNGLSVQQGGVTMRIFPNHGSGVGDIGTYESVDLGFLVGNSEKMRINTSGNLGINTTTPKAKLDVVGTISGSALRVNGTANVLGAVNILGDNQYGLGKTRFHVDGIQTGGDVYGTINNVTLSGSSFGVGSIIHNAITVNSTWSSYTGLQVDAPTKTGGSNVTTAYGLYVNTPGVGTSVDAAAYFNGNVGIGSLVPHAKLDVAGTISGSSLTVSGLKSCSVVVTNANGVTSCGTAFTSTSADSRYVNTSGDTMTGALLITVAGGSPGNTLVVDTTTLVVDATNNRVGIGTASPGDSLEVVMSGTSQGDGITIKAANPSGAGSQPGLVFKGTGGDKGSITYEGGPISLNPSDGSTGVSSNALKALYNATYGNQVAIAGNVIGGTTLSVNGTMFVTGAVTLNSTLDVTGAVTGGTYNGQTISTNANFTGTMAVANNVGIGASAGDAKLEVIGTMSGRGLVINGTSRFNGNVGILTTADQANFEVNGTMSGGGLYVRGGEYVFDQNGDLYAGNVYSTNWVSANYLQGQTSSVLGQLQVTTNGPATDLGRAGLEVGSGVVIGRNYVGTNAPYSGLIVEGRVGIGTATPTTTLDVNGSINATNSINIGGTAAALQNIGGIIQLVTDGQIEMVPGGYSGTPYDFNILASDITTNYFTVKGVDGNVGIGNADPDAKLEVNGTMSGYALTVNGASTLNGALQVNSGTHNYIIGGGNFGIGTSSPKTSFEVIGTMSGRGLMVNGTATFNGAVTFASTAQYSGNVGVKTTPNNAELEVLGTISGSSLNVIGQGTFGSLNVGGGNFGVNANGNISTNGSLQATTSNNSYFTGGGNLGIGLSSPKTKLEVVGTISGSLITQNGAGLNYLMGNLGIGTTTPSDAKLEVAGTASGSVVHASNQLRSSGTLVVTGTGTFNGNLVNLAYRAPILAGSVTTGSNPRDVVVQGRYAYVPVYGSNRIEVYDVTTQTPVLVGSGSTGSNPHQVAISGQYAYVANWNGSSMQIFDVSNPRRLRLMSTTTLGSVPGYIAVAGRTAYVTNILDTTISVIDVSNPAAPVVRQTFNLGSQQVRQMVIQGRYLYGAGSSNNLQILDIEDPTNIKRVSQPSVTGAPNFIQVSGRYAYLGAGSTMRVYDVANPASASEVGSLSMGATIGGLFISGRYLYVTAGTELKVIDVSVPTAPRQVSTVTVGGSSDTAGLAIAGHYAYVPLYNSATMKVYDISGFETTSATIHSLEAGTLQIRNDVFTQGSMHVMGSLDVGVGGILSRGPLSVISSGSLAGTFMGNVGIKTLHAPAPLTVSGGVIITTNGLLSSTTTAKSGVALEVMGTVSGSTLRVSSGATLAGGLVYVSGASGNVGIGVSKPKTKLEVVGTISGALITQNGAGNNYFMGNTAIGKTSAHTKLDVLGTISGSALVINGTATFNGAVTFASTAQYTGNVGIKTTPNNAELEVLGAISGTTLSVGGGKLSISQTGNISTNGFLQVTSTNDSYFTGGGNVGIGLTTVNKGLLQIAAPDDSVKSALAIRQSNNAAYGFDFALDQSVDGKGYFMAVSNDTKTALIELDRTTNHVRFMGGNVGIKTEPDNADLEVLGTISGSHLTVTGTVSGFTGNFSSVYSNYSVLGSAYVTSLDVNGIAGWDAAGNINAQNGAFSSIQSTYGINVNGSNIFLDSNGTISASGPLQITANSDSYLVGSGNLGIGTSVPTDAKLEVIGTMSGRGLMVNGTATFNGAVTFASTAQYTGNVGIKTAPNNAELEVLGTISGSALRIGGGTSYYFDGSGNIGVNGIVSTGNVSMTGNVGIGTTNNSDAKLEVVGTISGSILRTSSGINIGLNKLYVSGASGNVGIGTGTPNFKLHVAGDIKSEVDVHANVGRFSQGLNVGGSAFFNDGTASNPGIAFVNQQNTGIFRPGSGILGFTTNSSERLRIDSAGNVGINTTSAKAKLDVVGTISGSTLYTTRVSNHLVPTTTNALDLGTSALRWRDLYLSGGTLNMGTASLNGSIKYFTGERQFRFDADSNGTPELTIDGTAGSITFNNYAVFNGNIGSDMLPITDATYHVGSPSQRWLNGYFSGTVSADTGSFSSLYSSYSWIGEVNANNLNLSGDISAVNGYFSGNGSFSSVTSTYGFTSTSGPLIINNAGQHSYFLGDGNVGIGTSTPTNKLEINGGITVASGALMHNAASGVTTIDNLRLGAMSFDTDAGVVSWADLPVSTSASSGTVESYTAQLNGNPILTVYGKVSATAGVTAQHRVGILKMDPQATLDVAGTMSGAILWAGKVGSHLIPTANVTYDLGTSALRWRDLYLSGGTLNMGTTAMSGTIKYYTGNRQFRFDANNNGTPELTIDGTAGSITFNNYAVFSGNIGSSMLPLTSSTYDIGSSSSLWSTVYSSNFYGYNLNIGNGNFSADTNGSMFALNGNISSVMSAYTFQITNSSIQNCNGSSVLATDGSGYIYCDTDDNGGISSESDPYYFNNPNGYINSESDPAYYNNPNGYLQSNGQSNSGCENIDYSNGLVTNCNSFSDRRLKMNILSLETDVLTKISKLNGVTYDWNDTYKALQPGHAKDGRQLGLIAQDVAEVFPELVIENDNGYLGVSYAKLSAVLVEGIKALDHNVDTLSGATVSAVSSLKSSDLTLSGAIVDLRAKVATGVTLEVSRQLASPGFAQRIDDMILARIGSGTLASGPMPGTVTGSLTISNTLISQMLVVNSGATIRSLFAADIAVSRDLLVHGGVTASTAEIAGDAAVRGSLTVNGSLNLNAGSLIFGEGSSLSLQDLTVRGALRVLGDVTIDGLAVLKDVRVRGELIVSGRQAGYAELKEGQTSVTVHFGTGFTSTPVVSASPDVPVLYAVSKASGTGFTIRLKDPATEKITFSWVALATDDPKTAREETVDVVTLDNLPEIDSMPLPQDDPPAPAPDPVNEVPTEEPVVTDPPVEEGVPTEETPSETTPEVVPEEPTAETPPAETPAPEPSPSAIAPSPEPVAVVNPPESAD